MKEEKLIQKIKREVSNENCCVVQDKFERYIIKEEGTIHDNIILKQKTPISKKTDLAYNVNEDYTREVKKIIKKALEEGYIVTDLAKAVNSNTDKSSIKVELIPVEDEYL